MRAASRFMQRFVSTLVEGLFTSLKKLLYGAVVFSILFGQPVMLFADELAAPAQDAEVAPVSKEEVQQPALEDPAPLVDQPELQHEGDTADEPAQEETIVQQKTTSSQAPVVPNFQGDSTTQQKVRPETDPSTGALVYTYPIDLPQGVRGLTPSLSFTYNSQDTANDSILGYGWSLSIPYIKRQNLHGTDKLYTANDFVSSDFGELVHTGKTTYAPRATSTPLALEFNNNTWSYITKEGLTYTFGDTAASRQDDPQNTSNIYTWMLSSITDTYGNTIAYTYTKDQGQIYPEDIMWAKGLYGVHFDLLLRKDQNESYKTAFFVRTRFLISSVRVVKDPVARSPIEVSTLVVGGGGGGANGTSGCRNCATPGSGGNAGDVLYEAAHALMEMAYPVSVGNGGSGGAILAGGSYTKPGSGTDSIFDSLQAQGGNAAIETIAGHPAAAGTGSSFASSITGASATYSHGGPLFASLGSLFTASPNTGDAGGGGCNNWTCLGGNGGSGIVVVRYPTSSLDTATSGGTKLIDGSDTVHIFTASDTFIPKRLPTAETQIAKNDLTYDIGNNAMRSLLVSITQTNFLNGQSTTLPKTSFTYTKYSGADFYDGSGAETFSSSKTNNTDLRKGSLVADINGDSYPDIVKAYYFSTYPGYKESKAMIFNPQTNSFDLSSLYTPPSDILIYDESIWNSFDGGTRAVDVNGDMRSDLVRTEFPHSAVPISTDTIELNSDHGWKQQSSGYPSFVNNPWYTIISADLNGDGMTDYLQDSDYRYVINCTNCMPGSSWYTGELWATKTSLNDGFGFNDKKNTLSHNGFGTSAYAYTPQFTGNDQYFVFDINGDNLPDLIKAQESIPCGVSGTVTFDQKVYINTGTDWKLDTSYKLPNDFYYTLHGCIDSNASIMSGDFNRDGLIDMFALNTGTVYINQGKSFKKFSVSNNFVNNFSYIANQNVQNKFLPLDIDGDGAIDFMFPYSAGASGASDIVFKNTVPKPLDLLESITTSSGATYSATYKSSAQYKSTTGSLLNPKLPMVIQTVNTITDTDPATGASNTHTYTYKDGSYYYDASNPTDRKFAGFGTVVDASPTKIVTTYYHTGSGIASVSGMYRDSRDKIGRAYREDIADPSGTLLKTTYTRWDSADTRFGGAHIRPIYVLTRLFGKQPVDAAVGYTYYAETGDVQTVTEYGRVRADDEESFVDDDSDTARITAYTYAADKSGNIRMPASVTTADQKGAVAASTIYEYDKLSKGELIYGSPTSVAQAVDAKTYSTTTYAYDPLQGFMTSSTDPLGNKTSYTYDSYGLYPVIITNPLTHTTSATYDYSIGKALTTTDQNSITTTYTYDPFGRTLSVTIPDPNTANPALKSSYVYDDTPGARSVKETQHKDAVSSTLQTQYIDGFDRAIQKNTQTDTGYVAMWTTYDPDGLVVQQTLPMAIANDIPSKSLAQPALIALSAYDALGRVVSVTDTTGTNKTAYEGLTTRTWDHKNVEKDFTIDAFGNLTSVTEYDAGKPYVTAYAYDLNNDLIKITDALGNTRSFAYDMRGMRLSAEDIHPKGATFGVYTYTYDLAGNMASMRTPAGVLIKYAYDPAGKRTLEDSTATPQKDITYTYDTCLNGIGRLCGTVRNKVQKDYAYNTAGQVATEQITIQGTPFTTTYTYDLQGNPTQITYPDSTIAEYKNGTQGIKSIDVDGAPYIKNITYAETGAPLHIERAGGATTDYTYDPVALYRLTNLASKTPLGTVQDDQYIYDSRGLMTHRQSSAPSYEESVDYIYDDLMRVLHATSDDTQGNIRYDHTYAYSPLGSILSDTAIKYSYKTHPHAPVAIGGTAVQYDKNGNRTAFGTTAYTYTYRNEMASYTDPAYHAAYMYDDSGARVLAQDINTDTYFPNKYTSYDAGSSSYTDYIYAGNTLIGKKDPANGITDIFTNTLGSTIATADAAGNLLGYTIYEPYGSEQQSTQSLHKGYIGQYTDPTDLSYLNARYYESQTGQFLSQDPVFWELGISNEGKNALMNPQSMNSYSYAGNNPVSNKDPSGRCFWDACAVEALAVMEAAEIIGTLFTAAYTVDYVGTQLNPNVPSSVKSAATDQVIEDAGAVLSTGLPSSMFSTTESRAVSSESSAMNKSARLQANKIAGATFESEKIADLAKTLPEIKPQVTLKTASGVKTKVDIIGRDTSGNICIFECKSSATAPLTKNQSLAFPEIQKSGATVVGKGKLGFPGGMSISPTKVTIIRPNP